MNFLAICTVSRATLISLEIDGKNYTKTLEFSRHSENLFPLLMEMLEKHDLKLSDFDCFGCVTGPGSFTGIRIGMSVIKGFGFALNKPIVAISSLELLAQNRTKLCKTGKILAVINAGAGLVYHQAFELQNGYNLKALYQPKLDSFKHFAEFKAFRFGENVDTIFCQNDEKGADYTADFCGSENFSADSLTDCVKAKISAQEFTSAVEVAPLYLRVSSAEQNIRDAEFCRLGKDDLDDICVIESQADEYDLPWSRTAILDSLNNPNFECFGLKNSGGLWGIIAVQNGGSETEILRVKVRASARELGLGNRLISELIALKTGAGCDKILLEVNEHNFPAISLYLRNGFLRVGERKKYYHNTDSAILMTLNLV